MKKNKEKASKKHKKIKGYWIHSVNSRSFYTGDNFCDFLFAILHKKKNSENGSILKGIAQFSEGSKNNLNRLNRIVSLENVSNPLKTQAGRWKPADDVENVHYLLKMWQKVIAKKCG